jgi:hypothetical protein
LSNIAKGSDKNIHYADDFNDPYNGDYFCPNELCNVKMILKNLGLEEKSNSHLRPYFSAIAKNSHINNCEYSQSSVSYEQLKNSGFKTDEFFSSLFSITKKKNSQQLLKQNKYLSYSPNKKSINTVGSLYRYCLQHKDDHELPDGTRIYEIYQEKRNENISFKYRQKTRLIKFFFNNCNFTEYDHENNCYKIWCIFPHTENLSSKKYFTLRFNKDNLPLMQDICRNLIALKKRNSIVHIVVAGKWEGNYCNIVSKKQIFVVNYIKNL